VSMSHNAYAFDWSAFVRDELHNVLLDALSSGDERGLIRYIEANRHYIKVATEAASYPMTGRTVLGTMTFMSLETSL